MEVAIKELSLSQDTLSWRMLAWLYLDFLKGFFLYHSQNSVLLRFVPYIPVLATLIYQVGKLMMDIYYPRDTKHLDPHDTGPPALQNSGRLAPHETEPPDVLERLAVLDEKLDRLFSYLEHFRERENLDRVADRRASSILSPARIESSSQAQAKADHMALTIHSKEDVKDVAEEYQPRAIAQGSKVLHRRFDIGPHTGKSELDKFRSQVIESMRRARMIDKDCTLQFGSLAVLKYTDAGLTWWKLQEHWTPFISHISRASATVLDLLLGSITKWTIRGFNLQTATLKATTIDGSENLNISHHYKMETGEDVLLCEEPHLVQNSAPLFQKKVYICASKFVEVEDGVTFSLQSELQNVPRAYWISVVKSVIPSVWTMIMILNLSLMRGLSRGSRLATDGWYPNLSSLKLSGLQRVGNIFVGSNSEGNSILSNVLSELYSLIRVYLFATLIPIVVSTLWPLSRALFPSSDNDESCRLPLKYEGGETMTRYNAISPSSSWEKPSTANSVQNSSIGEDESGEDESGSISSGSSSLCSSPKSNEAGGCSVTWTANATETVPSTTKSSLQEEVAVGSHHAEVQPPNQQEFRDQRHHLSANLSRPSSSSCNNFAAGDRCPPYGSRSICGQGRLMEDAIAAIPSFLSLPCDTSQCLNSFHFFGVYDGHGGPEVAVYCADRLHHILAEEMTAAMSNASPVSASESWDIKWKKAMLTCFLRIDAEVGGEQCGKPEGYAKLSTDPIAAETVGSTAVVAVVSSSQLIVANFGDSRAVLCRGGHAIALSRDHKAGSEAEMARIEAAGGSRVLEVLPISRFIGDRYLKPYVIAEPEVTCTERTEEDEFLILASDGIWDMVSNEVVCDIARKCRHLPTATALGFSLALLTKCALDRGSTDDISVVVLDLRTVTKRHLTSIPK